VVVVESPERLGESLVLVGGLASRRKEVERRFPLLPNPRASTNDRQDRRTD